MIIRRRGDGMRDDPIAQVLDDLLKLDDILACMVARRNMISVMPSGEGFKPEVNQIWDNIHRAMDDVFGVIGAYSQIGLGEMEFRNGKVKVGFLHSMRCTHIKIKIRCYSKIHHRIC